MALSLVDMKDHQMSTPNQLSLQPGVNESRVLLNSKQKSQGNSCTQIEDVPDRGKGAVTAQSRSSGKETFPESETHKSTLVVSVDNQSLGTSQTLYGPELSTSFSIPNPASITDQMMKEGDVNLSEKQRRSKNRRQRRRAAAQQIVGLTHSPSAPAPVLLWFRRDLRLCDNPALISSLELDAPVIPIFIWSPEEEEGPGVTVAMGGACKLP